MANITEKQFYAISIIEAYSNYKFIGQTGKQAFDFIKQYEQIYKENKPIYNKKFNNNYDDNFYERIYKKEENDYDYDDVYEVWRDEALRY